LCILYIVEEILEYRKLVREPAFAKIDAVMTLLITLVAARPLGWEKKLLVNEIQT